MDSVTPAQPPASPGPDRADSALAADLARLPTLPPGCSDPRGERSHDQDRPRPVRLVAVLDDTTTPKEKHVNKKDLIETVAEHTGTSKTTVAQVLGGVLEAIQLAVAAGDKVSLTGFGTFDGVHREARTGRNPSTGAQITIAESWVPKFRPGSEFKEAVDARVRAAVSA